MGGSWANDVVLHLVVVVLDQVVEVGKRIVVAVDEDQVAAAAVVVVVVVVEFDVAIVEDVEDVGVEETRNVEFVELIIVVGVANSLV